jgi:ArsR family transcriptional regulator
METTKAVQALAALAQETRLQAFRLLVQRGPDGMAAGAIAESLGVVRATLSFHLAQLERAELLNSRRQSRQIFYAANFDGIRRLLGFLTEDCCEGRPEICGGLSWRALQSGPAGPETAGGAPAGSGPRGGRGAAR